jgi:hypothetical protein
MAKPSTSELQALHNLITEADLILSTTDLPQGRARRCRELLRTARALTEDFIQQAKLPTAAVLGHKGGSETAKRYGPDHFRELAAKRKTRGGGRPRKTDRPSS